MKRLVSFWICVADELATLCCTSTNRDIKTVTMRTKTEGLSFLTITLPNFGKDFERSLDQGFVGSSSFCGFHRRGGLPAFLSGFLELVFDAKSGLLVNNPSIEAIYAVRQLCYLLNKIQLPCSDARVEASMQRYIDCEKELQESDREIPSESLDDFGRIAHLLFGNIFDKIERDISNGALLTPKHGPGSTSDGLRGNAKYDLREWTLRLERVFPFLDYALPSPSYYSELDHVEFFEPGAERPVKVITVPKTLKTPRIIAIEPTCMQYTQQALLRPLVSLLEHNTPHDYFSDRVNVVQGMIGFSDQVPNQDLARQGSFTRSLATLDLSEASDRVSNLHVMYLLERHPLLLEAVQSCRSMKADVPVHGVQHLHKFASMGSALCFPFEAMVFLTMIFLSVEQELRRPLTRNDVLTYSGKVRVYGDDLIVPVELVHTLTRNLKTFGHKVNEGKSFWTGMFRESCGREFFAGEDVSIFRVRMEFPESKHDASEILSMVALRNNAYMHGMWKTAQYLDRQIVKYLPHFPTVSSTSPMVGRHTLLNYQVDDVDTRLHRPLVKGYRVRARNRKSKITGIGALQKWFLKDSDEPFEDPRHLERHGRPDCVALKFGSGTPF